MANRIRVCVWDNNEISCQYMIDTINSIGKYFAIEYKNTTEDIQELTWKNPEILILDLDKTITDIALFIVELKQQMPQLKVIGVSKDKVIDNPSDYGFVAVLNKEFTIQEFLAVVAPEDISRDTEKCNVITFFSPKAKSGKTTLITNLAIDIAEQSGEKVGIIDAETCFADVDVFYNLKPKSTIIEVIRDIDYIDEDDFEQYFTKVNDNVSVLCGSKNPQLSVTITPEALVKIINIAKKKFKYLLVDIAPGFNLITIAVCEEADKVYLMAMYDDGYEVYHLNRAVDIFHSLDNWEQRIEAIIMRLKPDRNKQAEIEAQLGVPVILLPNEYVQSAQSVNKGDIGTDKKTPLAQEIYNMATHLCGL